MAQRVAVIVSGFNVDVHRPDNWRGNLERLERFMPANYTVKVIERGPSLGKVPVVLIVGEDKAGWTLDDYVIPRLASGLIFAQEVI